MKMRQAVILAGGMGTRLGQLTKEVPKPFLQVGGQPFVVNLLNQLAQCGVEQVVFSLGHLAKVAEDALKNISHKDLKLTSVTEDSPLGTGGGLRHCMDILDDQFFVMNGDSFFGFDLTLLTKTMGAMKTKAALALRPVNDTSRYGSVHCQNSLVTSFAEKTASSGPGTINAGIYAIQKDALRILPDGPASLERDFFPQLAANRQLAGVEADGFFIDIGIPEDYDRAQDLFSHGQVIKGL